MVNVCTPVKHNEGIMSATILLVEDEAEMCNLVSQVLSPLRSKIIFAENWTDALTTFAKNLPRVVLLNYKFPQFAGGEPEPIGLMLLEVIKTQKSTTQVIMLTGSSDIQVAF